MTTGFDADVLIIGGGPVGLVGALDLDAHGVSAIVVEERAFLAPPSVKANHVSSRTMERLRRLGVADDVRAAGLPQDHPHDVAIRTSVTGGDLARIVLPSPRGRAAGAEGADTAWATAEPPHRINQTFLEPILQRHAAARPHLELRMRTRFLRCEADEDGVTAWLLDLETGAERSVRGRYLIGADGGRSLVRKHIGARLHGDPVLQHVQSTCVRVPALRELMAAAPAWGYYTYNPRRSGHVFSIDGMQTYLVHNHLSAAEAEAGTVERMTSLRAILGIAEDVPVEVVSEEDWIARRLVVDRLRDGRVFIAGDAAHLWVPYAGYGMNAGIADVLDLTWLLAATVSGWAPDSILDAYEAERLPITDQVSRFAMAHQQKVSSALVPAEIEEESPEGERARAALGATAYALNVEQFAAEGLNFGYVYDASPIIAYDSGTAPAYTMGSYTPSTVPGCRAPHLFLEDGSSLYDHLGPGYSLVCLADPAAMAPLLDAAAAVGMPLAVIDARGSAAAAYDHPYVVAREDQHIAWRGDAVPLDPAGLIGVLTGRTDEAAEPEPPSAAGRHVASVS
ncbi:MAG: FAD-dependent monooxygenase [Leifsonia sp.]|uniref:FAD-dependent monooxygenase n=1 Tax=Leifsonia sp. TaxID=1870902 RepID=UPI003F7F4615